VLLFCGCLPIAETVVVDSSNITHFFGINKKNRSPNLGECGAVVEIVTKNKPGFGELARYHSSCFS
jgi:hypothetical protein